jgi:hypothetical protein
MAYGNKLLSIDALLAAWQNRNQMENNSTQTAMQQKLAEKQLEAQQIANEQAEWNLLKEKSPSIVTGKPQNELTGEYGLSVGKNRFLKDMPGYIGGVSPQQVSDERNKIAVALASGSGWGGGGGGQTEEDAALKTQQANLLEEQSRTAQKQRQGYGDADKYLIAQKLAEAQIGKSQDRGYDELIGGLRDQSKSTWNDINAGDKRIDDTRSMMSQTQNEIDKTGQQNELQAVKNLIFNSPVAKGNTKLIKKASMRAGELAAELAARDMDYTQENVNLWLESLKKER